ncbi:glutaredoxin family protein [Candidatus Saccharibacteria bacterium]|nr:glutaredoxin family protein [Candidatus Saccharibacteria bacterium]
MYPPYDYLKLDYNTATSKNPLIVVINMKLTGDILGLMPEKNVKSQITIYGAEWCPPCHIAKDYLKNIGLEYKYVNIDEDREAGMAIVQKTGWRAVPIIQVGDQYLLGFERAKLDEVLRAAKLLA